MAITIPVDKEFNKLILDSFNTKDATDGLVYVNNTGIGYGYDVYSIDPALGFKDDNELALYILKVWVSAAATVEVLGNLRLDIFLPMTSGKNIESIVEIVKWLRTCDLIDTTVHRELYSQDDVTVWYTNPVLKMADPNLTLKSEVENNIKLNNGDTSLYTEFDQNYLDMKSVNDRTSGISQDILIKSRTAKSLSDIVIYVEGNQNVVNLTMQWIKSCGFTQAKFELDPDGTPSNRIQLA